MALKSAHSRTTTQARCLRGTARRTRGARSGSWRSSGWPAASPEPTHASPMTGKGFHDSLDCAPAGSVAVGASTPRIDAREFAELRLASGNQRSVVFADCKSSSARANTDVSNVHTRRDRDRMRFGRPTAPRPGPPDRNTATSLSSTARGRPGRAVTGRLRRPPRCDRGAMSSTTSTPSRGSSNRCIDVPAPTRMGVLGSRSIPSR